MPATSARQPLPFLQPLLAAALALASFTALAKGTPSVRWGEPRITGMATEEALSEISGLIASRRHKGVYWSHNDSASPAELYAITDKGKRLATLSLAGIVNNDWEDLGYFYRDGHHYLVIADTGDNGGIREELQIIVIEEPQTLRPRQEIKPAWVQRFRWPDGPRDCEAMVVDAQRGKILLISKKRVPPELFSLPLGPSESLQTAELATTLPGIDQPDAEDLQANPVYGRYRSQITAADLSPDGQVLAVLNYSALYFYTRKAETGWRRTLVKARPGKITLPWLPQAEAVAFAADGKSLLIGSEQIPSPLLRYRIYR